jgi:hypothetical protein
MKIITKESGKVHEVGVANIFSGHPSHGNLLSIPKHKSGKELMNQSDVVMLLNLHERMEAKLARDPHGLRKIGTVLGKMREIHDRLRANRILLECSIELLHDQLLFCPDKATVTRIARESIHVPLPHLNKLCRGQTIQGHKAIKLGLLSSLNTFLLSHPCLELLGISSLLSDHRLLSKVLGGGIDHQLILVVSGRFLRATCTYE